jgi:hypothetical protein
MIDTMTHCGFADCGLRIADCGLGISQRQASDRERHDSSNANPQSALPIPQFGNLQSAISNLRIRNPLPARRDAIRNLEIRIPQFGNPQSAIRNPQLADGQSHFTPKCTPSGNPQ